MTGKIETSTIVGSVRKKRTGDTKQHAAKETFVILLLGMECHMYYSLKPRLSILDFLLQLRLTFKDKRALCNILLFTTPLQTISVLCATVLFAAIPTSILCVCYSIHICYKCSNCHSSFCTNIFLLSLLTQELHLSTRGVANLLFLSLWHHGWSKENSFTRNSLHNCWKAVVMSISSVSTEWNKTHTRITSCELYTSTEETHQGI